MLYCAHVYARVRVPPNVYIYYYTMYAYICKTSLAPNS